MEKEKKPLFEEMQFDNVQYAKDVLDSCEKKLKKCKKGLYISIIPTILSVMAFYGIVSADVAEIFIPIILILAIISYIVGGGLKVALSWGWKICKFAWFVVPVFPIDIAIALLAFGVVVYAFIFVPLVFVWLNYRQISKDRNAAAQYLEYCKPSNIDNNE